MLRCRTEILSGRRNGSGCTEPNGWLAVVSCGEFEAAQQEPQRKGTKGGGRSFCFVDPYNRRRSAGRPQPGVQYRRWKRDARFFCCPQERLGLVARGLRHPGGSIAFLLERPTGFEYWTIENSIGESGRAERYDPRQFFDTHQLAFDNDRKRSRWEQNEPIQQT